MPFTEIERPSTPCTITMSPVAVPKSSNLITHQFPLRQGELIVSVQPPTDLTKREAKRVCTFVDSLADDEQPALGPGQSALPSGAES